MSHPYEYHGPLLREEIPSLKGNLMLDIGCGKGVLGYMLKAEKHVSYSVGLDIWYPYLKFVKEHKVYDDVVLASADKLPFKALSFDLVLASEVIEHLPKMRGWIFLKEVERVCKYKIIITTPRGFWEKGFLEDSAPTQRHLSGWTDKEFKRLGYRILGVGFRIGKWAIFYKITVVHRFSKIAAFLIAIKEKSTKKK